MLSDLLSDTLASIEEYQGEFPGSYTVFREEIEQVKRAMARLLIRLDTPPEMSDETWVEGMAKVTEAGPAGQKDLMKSLVYHVRREQVAEALGRDHPMVVRLLEAEGTVSGRGVESRRRVRGVIRPDAPGARPDFDREISHLGPDGCKDDKQGCWWARNRDADVHPTGPTNENGPGSRPANAAPAPAS